MSRETIYSQDVEFEASVSLETNRIPDPYHYFFKNGKLYSPVTNEPVENSIRINSHLDKIEAEAFQKIQKRLVESEEGMVVWISPPHPERSTDTKITFSDIVYELGSGKKLRNRAVCIGLTPNGCVALARQLGFSGAISAEELRASPLFLDQISPDEFVDILAEYTQKQARIIKSGEDFITKENLKARIALGYTAPIGPYPSSCGPALNSAFNIMFSNSLNISEAYFDCPKCHKGIPSGRGITTCPHWGQKRRITIPAATNLTSSYPCSIRSNSYV